MARARAGSLPGAGRRRICVATGTRAEYGLLRPLMEAVRADASLELQTLVTGAHLSPEFGLTWKAISEDGLPITRKVEMLLSSDSSVGIAKSAGLGLIGFAEALADLKPDLLVILGDRYEMLALASAALICRVPIAHLHGGEVTEGAFDEGIRHAITKMAHLHFTSAEEYRARVVQLGEDPARVFNVGAIGIDNVKGLELLSRRDLEASLGFSLGRRSLLVTFHPATLEPGSAARQTSELLAALDALPDTRLLFTLPNSDPEGRAVGSLIQAFAAERPDRAAAFTSLGQVRYLSALRHVDGVVGNSSSGIIEAPAFKVGTVNIGDRQAGRIKAASVIDCRPERADIARALRRLFSPEFRKGLARVANPYGTGGTARRIARVLADFPLEGILGKKFYNLPPGPAVRRARQASEKRP